MDADWLYRITGEAKKVLSFCEIFPVANQRIRNSRAKKIGSGFGGMCGVITFALPIRERVSSLRGKGVGVSGKKN